MQDDLDKYMQDWSRWERVGFRLYAGPRLSLGLLIWKLSRGRIHVLGVAKWDKKWDDLLA